jgi:hypothetical protein
MERLALAPDSKFKGIWPGWGPFLGNGKPPFTPKKRWVSVAEGLARDNGGEMPYASWLIHNGYGALYRCMRRHPELFMHVVTDSRTHGWKIARGKRNAIKSFDDVFDDIDEIDVVFDDDME